MSFFELLVLVHVLSAIVGVGPTYASHLLLRKGQTVGELRSSLKTSVHLDYFPKIGGTIAVLSGLGLVIYDSAYAFSNFFIWMSIVVYILIQILVIAIFTPKVKALASEVMQMSEPDGATLPQALAAKLAQANNFLYLPSALGTILFALMILKPVFN